MMTRVASIRNLAAGLVLAALSAGPVSAAAGVDATVLRSYTLHGLDGASFKLADAVGDVVVVNFWASWCKPCRKELPLLNDLNDRLASRRGRVVTVSIDRDLDRARDFVEQHGLTLPVYHDGPDGLARVLDLDSVPFTIVLARDGTIAHVSNKSGEDMVSGLEDVTEALLRDASAVRVAEGESK